MRIDSSWPSHTHTHTHTHITPLSLNWGINWTHCSWAPPASTSHGSAPPRLPQQVRPPLLSDPYPRYPPLLPLPGSRQEEALHRSPLPHEWRLARRTSLPPRRSDGSEPGEQEERHTAGLRAGADTLRQYGEYVSNKLSTSTQFTSFSASPLSIFHSIAEVSQNRGWLDLGPRHNQRTNTPQSDQTIHHVPTTCLLTHLVKKLSLRNIHVSAASFLSV